MSERPAALPVIVHDPRIPEQPAAELNQSGTPGWSRAHDGSVLLHAGPVGVDPLAWRIIGNTLHLSRYAPTLASLTPRAGLDLETLRHIARIEYPESTGSCFAGVRRLPPGTELTIDTTGHEGQPRPWWQLPPEPAASFLIDLWSALVAQCSALMSRWGDCAVLLSGGLDSAAIAAAASAAARHRDLSPPLLLSVIYPGLACDESGSQQMIARHLDLQLRQVDATVLELWPAAQESIQQRGIPTADLQAAATAQLLRLAREEGRGLVLMGLGGDALFAGDGAERELYRRGNLFAAHRFFQDWGNAVGLPASTMWYRKGFRRHLSRSPFGSREEIRAAGSANRSGLRRALRHPAHGWRAEMIENTVDPPAPTIGCPFYGKMFLDAFAQVRSVDLVQGPGFKGLLRQIVTPHLPAAVAGRQRKANFNDFHRVWIGREGPAMVERYETLRKSIPNTLNLPLEIGSILGAPDLSTGLLSAWFSLCLAEFYSSWTV